MKNMFWKKAVMAFAVSFGALFVPSAWAECALCSLAKNGDAAGIQELLSRHVSVYDGADAADFDVNGKRENGQFALLLAARYGHFDVVNLLLHNDVQNADPDLTNEYGRTALMWAAQNGDEHSVYELLQGGADIHKIGGQQQLNALGYARISGDEVVGGELIMRGLILAEMPRTSGYLHSVVRNTANEGIGSFNRMLAEGIFANLDGEFEIDGQPSILFAAVVKKNLDLAKAAHEDGADCFRIRFDGKKPVDVAHTAGHKSIRNYLIRNDCGEPECPDEYEWKSKVKSCVPTVAYCNEMDQIRNADFECESCSASYERNENQCIPSCGDNEELQGDSCVCISEYESVNGVCVAECAPDEVRDKETGECGPSITPKFCKAQGQFYDSAINACANCPSGHSVNSDGTGCNAPPTTSNPGSSSGSRPPKPAPHCVWRQGSGAKGDRGHWDCNECTGSSQPDHCRGNDR